MESKFFYLISKIKEYTIGTAPFCDGQPFDCDLPVRLTFKLKIGICS